MSVSLRHLLTIALSLILVMGLSSTSATAHHTPGHGSSDLEQRVEDLEAQVADLTERVEALEGGTASSTPEPTASPTPTPEPTPTPTPAPEPTPTPDPNLLFESTFTDDSWEQQWRYIDHWEPGFGLDSDFPSGQDLVSRKGDVLSVRAVKRDTPSGRPYAAGLVGTKDIFDFTYGYAEARIFYPTAHASWPAFWMPPSDRVWPPEIDILEAYPNPDVWPGPTRSYHTYHYRDCDGNRRNTVGVVAHGFDLTAGWHVWGMDWRPGAIDWYLDGALIKSVRDGDAACLTVAAKDMYLVLNMAVGNWSARADARTPNEVEMLVDYVRVYAAKP